MKLPTNGSSNQLRFLKRTHKTHKSVGLLSLEYTTVEDKNIKLEHGTHTTEILALEKREQGKSYIGSQSLIHSDIISGNIKTLLEVVQHH